jgi:predicted ATPase/DNA-binding SARP family transcriptional activator
MSESEELKIYTLGDLNILRSGKPVKALRSRKAQALLVYLACTSESHAREVLADLFWSESPPSRALSNLRDVIHALRTHLEPFMDITRYSIAINPEVDVWVDAAELEAALTALREGGENITTESEKKIEVALALYKKDFLEGFYLRGARGFEEWQVVERERIRLATLDGYISLVEHHAEMSNYSKGIYHARRALELEPLMEVGHQQLMRLLALSGRSSEALLQYEACRDILQKELGVEPSEETKALHEQLLKGEALHGTPTKQPQHNLPLPLSNLIGRDEELAQIRKKLEEPSSRLLTLIGVGGIGKTRLGLHTAAAAIDRYPDGVWLVELAALNEEEILPDEIAAVFGVSAQEVRSGIGVTDVLVDYLQDKSILLVLDNCEHLIDTCAKFAESLLNGCPNVKILATSREAFGIREERIFHVSPLSLPPRESSLNGKEIEKYPAVELFLERAATIQPDFKLTANNKPLLAEICWQLEGIPLAIELAAARVKVISLDQIARRLKDRFQLLTGGPRTALPRHQTLQATMDWSYGLLPELERALLRRLSVFSGGWALKAAEEVVSFGEMAPEEVLDLLCNLVDKSLVLVEDQGAKVRYGMLETVRQYGTRMLSEEEEVEEARRRHANFFVQLAEETDEGLRDFRQVESMNILDTEHDNLRGALRWATDSNETDLAFRLVGALGWYWFMRGHWKESWRWLQIAHQLESGSDPVVRAKAICRSVGLEIIRGNMIGTVELVEEAMDICRKAGNEEGLAWSLNIMGQAKTWFDEQTDEAIPYLSESVDLFSSLEDDWGVAFGLRYIGQMVEYQGEYERGINLQKESIALFERVGDAWNAAHSLFLMGGSATRHNDYELAEWALGQSLKKCGMIGDKVMEGHALRGLGQLALQKDDLEEAEEIYLEALEALQKIGDDNCVASVSRGLGEVAQRKGDFDKAAQFLSQSLLLYKKLGIDDFAALLIDRFASLAVALKKRERAARLLGASKDLDGTPKQISPPQYRKERVDLTTSVKKLLGEKEFKKLFEEGAAMSLEDAVAYALEETGEMEQK